MIFGMARLFSMMQTSDGCVRLAVVVETLLRVEEETYLGAEEETLPRVEEATLLGAEETLLGEEEEIVLHRKEYRTG